jgi:hypothetical protein
MNDFTEKERRLMASRVCTKTAWRRQRGRERAVWAGAYIYRLL